jgi:hypothetical protein
MNTSWSQTVGGTISIRFRPGLVVRLVGIGLIAIGVYKILFPIGQWVVSVFRPGGGASSVGDVVFALVALVVGAAFVVPGALLAFFGATARVEPVPRRVFARHGLMGFGPETVTDVGETARVVVRVHVDQNTRTSTTSMKDEYRVTTWKVFIEQKDAQPVEIGQFAQAKVARARQLAAAVAESLALPVADTSKALLETPTEEERLTSEFLKRRGIDAPPKGFKVQAIKVVRTIVEALFS